MSLPLSKESARDMRAELLRGDAEQGLSSVRKGIPRAAEALVTLGALLAAAPIIAALAAAIRLSSSGPVFFSQQRVGRGGRLFKLYKLRTMRPSQDGPQVTSSTDERITRLGRLLRRSKLDELPTLWNVLRGDMALVGPRPEVPRYVELANPDWQAVLSVRPGITDPVTIHLRNEEELLAGIATDAESYYVSVLLPSKLKGYVAYLERRDWVSDVKVLLDTAVVVVAPHSRSRR